MYQGINLKVVILNYMSSDHWALKEDEVKRVEYNTCI